MCKKAQHKAGRTMAARTTSALLTLDDLIGWKDEGRRSNSSQVRWLPGRALLRELTKPASGIRCRYQPPHLWACDLEQIMTMLTLSFPL